MWFSVSRLIAPLEHLAAQEETVIRDQAESIRASSVFFVQNLVVMPGYPILVQGH